MLASVLCNIGAKKSHQDAAQILSQWYESAAGQRSLKREQRLMDNNLPAAFRGHTLWYCSAGQLRFPEQAGKVVQLCAQQNMAPSTGLCCTPAALPFAAESVDLIVLHHAMDFAAASNEVLPEALRVLKKRGALVVIGFHGRGALGVSMAWHRLRRRPGAKALLSPTVLRRRLRKQGCVIDKLRYGNGAALANFCAGLYGNVFLLHAIKQRRPLTPIRLRDCTRRRDWRAHPHAAAPRAGGT